MNPPDCDPRAAARRPRRGIRAAIAGELAAAHSGVVHRADLRRLGVTREDVRTEIEAGRWHRAGRHTVVVDGTVPAGRGRLWWAIWESGSGAALDGVSALIAAGLRGFEADHIDVALPRNSRRHRLSGVVLHRQIELSPVTNAGIPRVRLEHAVIHAAQWAATDRTAMLVLCLAVQQRLVPPVRVLGAWSQMSRSPRRALLDAAIGDVCDGAHSLGELDFTQLCRRYGLPRPSRQLVRTLPSGRVYLDVAWEHASGRTLVVEIDGGHHAVALNPVDDAWRQNEIALGNAHVLRIPILGLRLTPERFMQQVARAHRQLVGAEGAERGK